MEGLKELKKLNEVKSNKKKLLGATSIGWVLNNIAFTIINPNTSKTNIVSKKVYKQMIKSIRNRLLEEIKLEITNKPKNLKYKNLSVNQIPSFDMKYPMYKVNGSVCTEDTFVQTFKNAIKADNN